MLRTRRQWQAYGRVMQGCALLALGLLWTGSVSAVRAVGPGLAWGNYLGGTGDEMGSALALDRAGNLIVAGRTASAGWVSGGGDTTLDGPSDAFVAKFSPAGALIWSTYVGGSEADGATGVAVGDNDSIVLSGYTTSPDWAAGGWDTTFGGSRDGFVAKLSAAGELLWSTYLGGDENDAGNAIAVDTNGDIVVTGFTASTGWVVGGWVTLQQGSADGFVVKLTSAGGHIWSTYFGGRGGDEGHGIAVDHANSIIVTGDSEPGLDEHGFPATAGWVLAGGQTAPLGGTDGFILKLTAGGGHDWSTYFGGDDWDAGQSVTVDSANNILVIGATWSAGWTAGGWDTSLAGEGDGFVLKLSPGGAPLWSSYLGGGESELATYDFGFGVTTDSDDSVLVTGETHAADWVAEGWDTTYHGNGDGFVVKLDSGGAHVWSTYLGASVTDSGRGIAVDAADNVFIAGYTAGYGDVWLTDGSDVTPNGSEDAFVLELGTSPLTATGFTPAVGATEVPVESNLVIDFGRDIVKGSGGYIYLRYMNGDSLFEMIPVADARVTVSGHRATINPLNTLFYNIEYYVLVDATCFRDTRVPPESWAGIDTPGVWTFSTPAAPPPHTVTFVTDGHGTIDGLSPQTVADGGATSLVTAVGAHGYVFDHWSDGSTENPRILFFVTGDQTLTAFFQVAGSAAPTGEFRAVTGWAGVASGRGLWDLTGVYTTSAAGNPLVLNLLHDSRGRLSGTATYTSAKATLTMPIKGNAVGERGVVAAKLILRGANPARTTAVALTLDLTVDAPARQLTGSMDGTVTLAGGAVPVADEVDLDLPPAMNGTWTTALELTAGPRGVTGVARLTLSNGVVYPCSVRGRVIGETVLLSLLGDPGDRQAKDIKIRTTAVTLEGGWATLQAFSGRLLGQALAW